MSCLSLMRKGLAEFVATGMLVFSASQINTAQGNVLGAGLGIGLTLACMAAAFGHISGAHMNPGVSLAFLLTGGMSVAELIIYWPSQIGGSIAGGVLSRLTMDNVTWMETKGGMVTLNTEIAMVWQGILLEGLVTFLLVITVLLTVEQKVFAAPLFIGLAVVVGIFHSGLITGGGLNSARAFGPAFAMWIFHEIDYANMYGVSVWELHWIYWVGPPAGAVIAAILFKIIFADQGHRLIKSSSSNVHQVHDVNGVESSAQRPIEMRPVHTTVVEHEPDGEAYFVKKTIG